MFGSKVRYCITYKTNQRSFQVYTRKFMHNFKVNINNENLEGSKGVEFEKLEIFFVTKIDRVIMYDANTYEEKGELAIKLLPSETREPNEIIAMAKCQNDEYLAVISGKNLIGAEQKINQLFVFRKKVENGQVNFVQQGERVLLRDMPNFTQCSMKFHFVNNKDTVERNEIIFANIKEIFKLNFITKEITQIYKI